MQVIKLQAHEKPITTMKLNFDGDLLFTGSSDKKINVWDAYTGERIGNFVCKGANRGLDITNDSKYCFTGSLDGVLEIFKVQNGELLGRMRKSSKCKCLELSYGDKELVVLYESFQGGHAEISIYETKNIIDFFNTLQEKEEGVEEQCQKLITFKVPNQKIISVKWAYLNKFLYAATSTGDLLKIDLQGNITFSKKVHELDLRSFIIAKDFSFILTAGKEGCKMIDPEDFNIIRSFKLEFPMNACSISPLNFDRQNPKYHVIFGGGVPAIEVTTSKEGGFEIRLLNLMTQKEIGQIPGHFGPVNVILFHQDGRGFISGGEEGVIRLHRFDKSYFEDPLFN